LRDGRLESDEPVPEPLLAPNVPEELRSHHGRTLLVGTGHAVPSTPDGMPLEPSTGGAAT